MSRATPDRIIAHVDLLRAVDRLLVQAQTVREKREALDRLLPSPIGNRDEKPTDNLRRPRHSRGRQ
jgi:hypothetical protein